jgi:transposase-like protein
MDIIIRRLCPEVLGLDCFKFCKEQLAEVLGFLNFEKSSCPHCGSGNFVKYGKTSLGRQCYHCRECGRTFSETTGTTFVYSKKAPLTWARYLFCMEGRLTLRNISKLLDMSISTAFAWRHKVLSAAETKTDTVLTETVEVDEFWLKENFKGSRSIHPCFRDVENRHLIILLSCRDSQGNILFKTAARKGLRKLHKGEISDILCPVLKRCRTLVSSRNLAFVYFAKQEKLRFSMPASLGYRLEGLTLKNAEIQKRGFLGFLKGFRSVASKYISHYVNWFRIILKKNNSLPAEIADMISLRERKLRVLDFSKVKFDGTLKE